MKKYWISVVVVFILGQILDFVIHGNLLTSEYQATADLWRPMDEMKGVLMLAISLIWALGFVGIFHLGFQGKGKKMGILYGLILGVISGFSMGLGSYCYMPITMTIAIGWTVAAIVHMLVAATAVVFVYQEQ